MQSVKNVGDVSARYLLTASVILFTSKFFNFIYAFPAARTENSSLSTAALKRPD